MLLYEKVAKRCRGECSVVVDGGVSASTRIELSGIIEGCASGAKAPAPRVGAPETESRVRADGHRCWREQVERRALLSLQLLRLDPFMRPPSARPLEFALHATGTSTSAAACTVVPA